MNPNESHMYSVEPQQAFSSLICTQNTVQFMRALMDGLKQRDQDTRLANEKGLAKPIEVSK